MRRNAPNPRHGVLRGRVHDVRYSELSRALSVARAANGSDDDGTAPCSKLRCDRSDTTHGSRDQHDDARYGSIREYRSMGRDPRNAETCPLGEGNVVGKADGVPRGDGYEL